jgi:hypothetical protein
LETTVLGSSLLAVILALKLAVALGFRSFCRGMSRLTGLIDQENVMPMCSPHLSDCLAKQYCVQPAKVAATESITHTNSSLFLTEINTDSNSSAL